MSRIADPTPKHQVHILVPKTLYEDVRKSAEDESRTVTEVIVEGLENYLQRRKPREGKQQHRQVPRQPVRQGRP